MAAALHKSAHFLREVLTLPKVCDKLLPAQSLVPWCSGLTCGPVKAEIAGSNPVGAAENNIDPIESRNENTHSDSLLFLPDFTLFTFTGNQLFPDSTWPYNLLLD